MLTPQLLETFPYYQYADYKTIQRGQQYFRDRRVYDIEYYDDYAVCQVEGNNDDYEVSISLTGRNKIRTECTCPYAELGNFCKHMVASMLALTQYLKSEEVQDDWQYQLSLALQNAPRRKGGSNVQRYAAVFLLQKDDFYQRVSFSLAPRVVKASQWGALKMMDDDPSAVNNFLDKNRGWTKVLEQPYQSVNPAGCMNLPPEGIAFFNFVLQQGRYYGFSNFPDYLPMLARLEIPIFLISGRHNIKERIQILTQPQEIKAAITRDKEHLSLQAGIEIDGQLFTSAKESLHIVSQNPPWALVGDKLLPVDNPESLDILQIFPLEIPVAQEETFREKYFRQIAERVPIQGDVVTWDDVKADAVPRLYLHNDKGTLRADLRFGYGDYESPADRDPAPVSTVDNPGSWTLTRIHRQPSGNPSFTSC